MSNLKKASLLLPNLRYNKYDKKIYFKTYRGVSFIENNKKKIENMFDMGELSLNGKLTLFDINIKCNIQEIEHYDGLIINIEYTCNSSNSIIYENQLSKIAKYIEGIMCKLDTSIINEFKDKNTFYDKLSITDSDSNSEHSYFHNNSNEPDNYDDNHDNNNNDNYDEEYYDDEDYDDPMY